MPDDLNRAQDCVDGARQTGSADEESEGDRQPSFQTFWGPTKNQGNLD